VSTPSGVNFKLDQLVIIFQERKSQCLVGHFGDMERSIIYCSTGSPAHNMFIMTALNMIDLLLRNTLLGNGI
jgi:hypothetical protein